MAGEEVILAPLQGILDSIVPVLTIVFLLAIVGLVFWILLKRKPFGMKYPNLVLIKHKRGKDFIPEITYGGRTKNKEQKEVMKCKNKDEIPAQFLKDIRTMIGNKKNYVEVWEDESGIYIPAPSPFVESSNDPPEFSQADVNWLTEQHKANIRMFEKKNQWLAWMPYIVPLITIFIVVFALILYQTQALGPLTEQARQIAATNAQVAQTWANITSKYTLCSNTQAIVVPGA